MRMKTLCFVFVSVILIFHGRIHSAEMFVNGYGSETCGKAISDIEGVQQNVYKTIYLAWLHGYLSSKREGLLNENMQLIQIKSDTFLGDKLSNETLTQLWIAKCRKEGNIPKTFFYISAEIYADLKSGKY